MSSHIATRLALLGILVAIAAVLWRDARMPQPSRNRPGQHVGTKMPDFELKDLSGKTWRRADLVGKAVFINVWASW